MIVRLISVRRRKLFWDGFFKFSDVILCYDSFHFDVRSHNKHNVLDSVGFNEYALEPVNNSPSSVAFAQWVRHAFSHRTIGQTIRLLDFLLSLHFSDIVQAENRTDLSSYRQANKQIAGYMQSYVWRFWQRTL